MRSIISLATLAALALFAMAASAPPAPAVAQADPFRLHLPVLNATCADAPICAALIVGPPGICCIGGRPGSTVEVPVSIVAQSRAGLPLEVRSDRGRCSSTAPIDDATWEPLAPSLRFSVTLPPNWTTWSMRVQLRDAAGALSPILCDDVALEGF